MVKSQSTHVSISERALVARIKRRLAADGSQLLAARPDSRQAREVGRFYVVDSRQVVTQTHVDLTRFAKDLGVLHAWERLEKD